MNGCAILQNVIIEGSIPCDIYVTIGPKDDISRGTDYSHWVPDACG